MTRCACVANGVFGVMRKFVILVTTIAFIEESALAQMSTPMTETVQRAAYCLGAIRETRKYEANGPTLPYAKCKDRWGELGFADQTHCDIGQRKQRDDELKTLQHRYLEYLKISLSRMNKNTADQYQLIQEKATKGTSE